MEETPSTPTPPVVPTPVPSPTPVVVSTPSSEGDTSKVMMIAFAVFMMFIIVGAGGAFFFFAKSPKTATTSSLPSVPVTIATPTPTTGSQTVAVNPGIAVSGTPVKTGGEMVKLNPASGTYKTGETFTVHMVVSGPQLFKAASATVQVSPNLSVLSINDPLPDYGPCRFTYTKTPTAADPSFIGSYVQDLSSNSCTVYTMTVKVVSGGSGTITLSNGSITAYKDGSQILSGVQSGAYTLQ